MVRTSRRRAVALLAATAAAALAVTGLTVPAAHADEVEQVKNGTFDDGTTNPWWWTANVPACRGWTALRRHPGGTANPWDASIGQNDIPLIAGETYTLSFTATAEPGASRSGPRCSSATEPYTDVARRSRRGADRRRRSTSSGPSPPPADDRPRPGRLPDRRQRRARTPSAWTTSRCSAAPSRRRTCRTPARGSGSTRSATCPTGRRTPPWSPTPPTPLPWQLRNGRRRRGRQRHDHPARRRRGLRRRTCTPSTSPAYRTPGHRLHADRRRRDQLPVRHLRRPSTTQLRSDALQFFYIQRSGIAIDGDLVGDEYARPAGHLGVAPNQGDTDVPCQPGVCDYRLDVRGGWYDAGDHGKYVVNGGIATYQLLSTFERTKTAPSAGGGAALGDGTLRVPERGNGVPDILDEARWELEFLLRMQVPAGKPLAGMAHHKIHDRNWTGLPLQPEDDPQPRELHPPSTAATLNLAAAAAQCARLFAPYDAAFADQAAGPRPAPRTRRPRRNPAVYADPNDGNGGGAYSDNDVSDEFYWAAAELYLTTGEAAYLADLTASPHHTGGRLRRRPASAGAARRRWAGSTWPPCRAGCRAAELAADPRLGASPPPTRYLADAARPGVRAADARATRALLLGRQQQHHQQRGGARHRVRPDRRREVPGRRGAGDGLHLRPQRAQPVVRHRLGREAPRATSTAGSSATSSTRRCPTRRPARSPAAPTPASRTRSPQQLLDGCAPMFCYVDDIDSYSTNEVAINWNSALAWIASFLADLH